MSNEEVDMKKKKKNSVKKVKVESNVNEPPTSDVGISESLKLTSPTPSPPLSSTVLVKEPVTSVDVSSSSSDLNDALSSSSLPNDTTTVPSSEESSTTEILFNKLVTQFSDLQTVIKTIHANMKILQKEVLKERKEYKKKESKIKKKSDKKKNVSGFEKLTSISKDLSEFLNLEEGQQISRREVTNKLIAYVKEFNLQNPADKRKIIPDEKLTKILQQVDDVPITFFNLQTHLKKHFIPSPTVVPSESVSTTTLV